MSNNLDTKLSELTADYYQDSRDTTVLVEAIKQAFIDNGWLEFWLDKQEETFVDPVVQINFTPGRGWYVRFMREWVQLLKDSESKDDTYILSQVDSIAKKAAGLE